MLFTQIEFLFFFFPLCLLGYFVLARFFQNPLIRITWLAVASLVFYGYWDKHFLKIILVSIVINYAFSCFIGKRDQSLKVKRSFLTAALLVNLGGLVYYKYANFGLHVIGKIAGHAFDPLSIVLPLGISFFTFTQITYLVDVYRGQSAEKNFPKYVLFVTFFPHLIAGPILHHSEMMPQFGAETSRKLSYDKLAMGLTIFAIGLFKKLLIADSFALLANPIFNQAIVAQVPIFDAWIAALSYSLQIYFDFSAYSDMAIGISILFGIRLPFNFDSPYKSRSIIEFWRRWHISLSRFLRDYLYFELGGNRKGTLARYGNLMITMVLGGLWHGAGITYLLWGTLHGLYLMVNHGWRNLCKKVPALLHMSDKAFWKVGMLLFTQLMVVIAWVFFKAEHFRNARNMLYSMFHIGSKKVEQTFTNDIGLTFLFIFAGYFICMALPNIKDMFKEHNPGLEIYKNDQASTLVQLRWTPTVTWAVITAVFLLLGISMSLIMGDRSPFLYFQF